MSGEPLRTATAEDFPCFDCEVRDGPMCAALEPHELHRLNAIVSEVRLKKHDIVFHQEDPATHLFNVTAGVVRLYRMLGDGRRQVTGFSFPGDFLGVAYGDSYAYSAEAVADVRLCRFPMEKLIALFDDFPKLEHRLLSVASNELVAAQDQILLLGRKTATEKLVSFILLLARRADSADAPATSVDLPMTRTDIADYLGLAMETVSRGIGRLVERGLIEHPEPHRIVLKDRDELEEIAEGF